MAMKTANMIEGEISMTQIDTVVLSKIQWHTVRLVENHKDSFPTVQKHTIYSTSTPSQYNKIGDPTALLVIAKPQQVHQSKKAKTLLIYEISATNDLIPRTTRLYSCSCSLRSIETEFRG